MGIATLRISDVIKAYLQRRQSEGYSPATLAAYEQHLRSLSRHLADPLVIDVRLEQLRGFLTSYAHLKSSSLGAKIRALRAFFRWVHEEGLTRGNPAARLKGPKQAQRVPKHLSVEELELLRDSCEMTFGRALIEVFFAPGARIAEVHGMNRDDVDWRESSILVLGKGSREREVYFGAKAAISLKRYLSARADDQGALFVTTHRPVRRTSIAALRWHVNKVANRAGLRDRVMPHVLRRTFATLMINQGAELVEVQSLLGHAKPETTLRYATLSGAARRRAYQRYFVQ
jgi:integrase/recombinase XerD